MKIYFSLLLILLSSCRYLEETKEVTWEETRPKVLLQKYEYFKDLSSTLDEQRANLLLYQEELKSEINQEYKQQRKSEMLGIASNYNHLAASYNSQMIDILS